MSDRIQNQITIYMTDKKLCEFNDKLKPAPVEGYGHLHAQGEKLPDGSRPRSCVGIVLQDYSNGKGQNTIRVSANLAPGFFAYALSRVQLGVETFEFYEDKIFGEPDAQGLSAVTKVAIKRASFNKDGSARTYPWLVSVENGRGHKVQNRNGGSYMEKGSYRKERGVFINISDYDFFQLMYRCVRYIETWELTYGPKVIREAAAAKAQWQKQQATQAQTPAQPWPQQGSQWPQQSQTPAQQQWTGQPWPQPFAQGGVQ